MSQTGLQVKSYFSTTALDGSTNTPDTLSWTEATNIRDETVSNSRGEADASTRGNNGFEQTLTTLRTFEISFDINYDTADSFFQALADNYYNDADLAYAAMDGDINTSGNKGVVSNVNVTQFEENRPLQDTHTVSVTIKSKDQTQRYTVA
jgi:hypothetical protein